MKRILIWCGGAPNQKALANKIAAEFELAGIVIESKKQKKLKLNDLFTKVADRTIFRKITGCWSQLMEYYNRNYPSFPAVKTLRTGNINTDEVFEFSREMDADLIVVSGTSLIRKKLLSLNPRIGIINLHTGLSPYVKGGPNCTNWCLANGTPELIGNTIMWIDAGIDSGNIITTKRSDIGSCNSFFEVHVKVMNDAHDLYLNAIRYLLHTEPPYNSVDQKSIVKGELYLTRMWTSAKKFALLRNIRKINSGKQNADIVEIAIPEFVNNKALPKGSVKGKVGGVL